MAVALQVDATAKALVDDLATLMTKSIHTFDARGIANAAWAFGKLKYAPNQRFPAMVAAAATPKIEQFSAQNLSNMLWSFVYLHYHNDDLLSAAAQQVYTVVGWHHLQTFSLYAGILHELSVVAWQPPAYAWQWSGLLHIGGSRCGQHSWVAHPPLWLYGGRVFSVSMMLFISPSGT